MASFDNPESSQPQNLALSNAMRTLTAISQTVRISDHGQLLESLLVERQAGAFTRRNVQAINTVLNRAPLVEAHRASLEAQAAVDSLQPLYQPYQPYPRFRRFGPVPDNNTTGPVPLAEAQTNDTAAPSTTSPQVPDNSATAEPQMNDTTAPSTISPQVPAPPTDPQMDDTTTPSTIRSPQAGTLSRNDFVSALLIALFYPIEQSYRTEAVPTRLNHRT